MTPRERKRVYAGIFALVALIFCGGILAGYFARNDKICRNGAPPKLERPDVALGHTVYLCSDGQMVTK